MRHGGSAADLAGQGRCRETEGKVEARCSIVSDGQRMSIG